MFTSFAKAIIINRNSLIIRHMSVNASCLIYSEYGEPVNVVTKCEQKLEAPQKNEVLVKILAAPINPADINTIQGKYPVKPKLPAVPGNECVAEILKIGDQVEQLTVGDRVVPFQTGLGTWCTHAIYKEKDILKIPKTLRIQEAATLTVNPCTAYRMLKDFECLKAGDTVIQNGSNSAVGQAVFQLCKAWNINCVGIVRDRPELPELTKFLKSLGANEILTEEQVRTTTLFKNGVLKKPKLAFNCVGGKNALEMLRHIADKGTMVTYGGMSREPVTIPTASLIFKDITFKGFWMTRWTSENYDNHQRREMFDEIIELVLNGKFKGPNCKMVPFDDYKAAIENALSFHGFIGQKYILDFSGK